MKILYTIQALALGLIPFLLNAQAAHVDKWYARVGVGYALPAMSQTTILNGLPIDGTSQISAAPIGSGALWQQSVTLKRASFGTGAGACAVVGYMLNAHLGIELGLQSTILPATYSFTEDYTGSVNSTEQYTTKAQPSVSVLPAVVLMSGGKNLRVYGRGGLVIPSQTK